MKKIVISVLTFLLIIAVSTVVFASESKVTFTKNSNNKQTQNVGNTQKETTSKSQTKEDANVANDEKKDVTSTIAENKEKIEKGIDKYIDKYGSETYGTVAYFLNVLRVYSIPLCFIGVAIGGIYQYAIGTRRLDMKQKGFKLILSFVTIFVICQVLPLVFVVVVKGWRG